MKLTGKCLDVFKEWTKHKGLEKFYAKHYSLDISTAMYNAVLIDFFDSVGININPEIHDPINGIFNYTVLCNNNFRTELGRMLRIGNYNYKTRTEATNVAIEKANEIFNLNNK